MAEITQPWDEKKTFDLIPVFMLIELIDSLLQFLTSLAGDESSNQLGWVKDTKTQTSNKF